MFERSHAGHDGPRPWLRRVLYGDPALDVPETIRVESIAFEEGAAMPPLFAADGEKDSPPLRWRGVPDGAAAVVLVVEDADGPAEAPFVHALAIKAPGQDDDLIPGALTRAAAATEGLLFGLNSLNEATWTPPDPPRGGGPHRYVFQVFAIDRRPDFDATPDRWDILALLRKHAMAKGCVSGIYERVA